MTTELDYTVLPVSALKKQNGVVFDTLKAGKTVYVANRGRVVAAFRPARFVPEAFAASATSPYVHPPIVNARVLGHGSVSQAIADASVGLVSIVEKDSLIYGILTPATTPEPAQTPDMDALGEKAEIMRQWREDHPNATIDEVMEHSRSLDEVAMAEKEPEREWPLIEAAAFTKLDDAAAIDELQHWKDNGSHLEDTVKKIITAFTRRPRGGAIRSGVRVPTGWPSARIGAKEISVATPRFRLRARETILSGEMDQAAGRIVGARTKYLDVLTSDDQQAEVGAAFALGNLARAAGNRNEAAVWYSMAFQANAAPKR
jgi:hypothetical protein